MPITVIVEDGTQVAGANSYISVADATAFLAPDPFVTKWVGLTDDQKAGCVIKATRLLDSLVVWKGARNTVNHLVTQALQWPRRGATDEAGLRVPHDFIPPAIVQATALIAASLSDALAESSNPEADLNDLRGISSIKVDVIDLVLNPAEKKTVIPTTVIDLVLPYGSSRESASGSVKLMRA